MGHCISKSSNKEHLIKREVKANENGILKIITEQNNQNLSQIPEDCLRLELFLEKNLVDSGETLKGHIHIKILDTLMNCELFMKFTGEALIGSRNGQQNALFFLKNWIEPINPSQICIPFEFIIPKNIKRSVCSFGGIKRFLKYYLEPVFKSHKGIYSIKELLNIEYDELDFKNTPYNQTLEHQIGGCRGEISIKKTWINRISNSGSPVEFTLEINNQRSLVNIISVEFEVSLSYYQKNTEHVENLKKWESKISIEKGTLFLLENQRIKFDSPENLKYFKGEYWLSITIKTSPECEKELKLLTRFGMRPLISQTQISLKELSHLNSTILPTAVLTYDPEIKIDREVIYTNRNDYFIYSKALTRD